MFIELATATVIKTSSFKKLKHSIENATSKDLYTKLEIQEQYCSFKASHSYFNSALRHKVYNHPIPDKHVFQSSNHRQANIQSMKI